MVQPTTLQAVTTIDVEEVEEVTAEAQFQDFRSKIAFLEWNVDACCLRCPFSSFVKSHVCLLLLFAATRSDELEWVKYTNQQQKVTARKHIMEVQHTRAQLATGRGLLV